MSELDNPQGQPGGDAAGLVDGGNAGTAGGAPGSRFDAAAYLASLPEDERGYWEQMPAEILAKNAQRTMLRKEYDRKRSEEGPALKTIRDQVAQLQQQNALLAQQLQMGPRGGVGAPDAPPPLDYESAKRLAFTTNDEDEYSRAFDAAVESRVRGVLESDPTLRQVRSALAMRSAASRVEGVAEADAQAAEALLRQDLQADGVDFSRLPERVVQFMFPNYLRLARMQRLEREREERPSPPRQPGAAAVIPPSAQGATPPTVPPGLSDPFSDPNSSVAARRKATLDALGLTAGDMARLRREV